MEFCKQIMVISSFSGSTFEPVCDLMLHLIFGSVFTQWCLIDSQVTLRRTDTGNNLQTNCNYTNVRTNDAWFTSQDTEIV